MQRVRTFQGGPAHKRALWLVACAGILLLGGSSVIQAEAPSQPVSAEQRRAMAQDRAAQSRAARQEAAAQRQAEQRSEYVRELGEVLSQLDHLIDSDDLNDQREALRALNAAARAFERAGGPHPDVQSRLAKLALADGRAELALDFVEPFVQSRGVAHRKRGQ